MDLQIIVLAGGSSSRFAPLTEKNLYKFMGVSVLSRQLQKLLPLGNIVVVCNQDNLTQITQEAHTVSEDIQVHVQIGSGQAGAVTTALAKLDLEKDVLIVNSNDIFDESMLADFKSKLQELRVEKYNLLTGQKVKEYFPGGYLIVKDGFVEGVVEKPGEGNEPSDLVRLVFDYFNKAGSLMSAIAESESAHDDLYEVALAKMMQSGQRFSLLEYTDEWRTIKYPWHVLSTSKYLLSQINAQQISPSAQIDPKAVINGPVVIGDNVKIFAGAIINGPAYIGPNSIVGNNALVRESMLGENCVVGFASEVARSYLANNVWLHMNYVGDSIIESNVSFGSTAVTANLRLDEGSVPVNVKDERIDSHQNKLGAIIASNVRLGVGVKLMPGIKIGGNSVVAPGLVVDQDVPADTYVSYKQEMEFRPNKLDISKLRR